MRSQDKDIRDNDRILRGSISAAGGVVKGKGFTVARSATGIYILTFLIPFVSMPVVYATVNGSPYLGFILSNGVTLKTAVIQTFDAAQVAVDMPFDFKVMESSPS